MVLKEAYRYQNFLSKIISSAENYLYNYEHYVDIKETHRKSVACVNAVDEVKDGEVEKINASVGAIVALISNIMLEKNVLASAIAVAKENECPSIDIDLAMNKVRHELIDTYNRMLRTKDKTVTREGTAYAFNNEGNQTPYKYNIEREIKVSFNRAELKKYVDELVKVCDATSTLADKAMANVEVNFVPAYNMNSTFEEIAEEFQQTLMNVA